MNHNDEFEDLIKGFKLNKYDEQQGPASEERKDEAAAAMAPVEDEPFFDGKSPGQPAEKQENQAPPHFQVEINEEDYSCPIQEDAAEKKEAPVLKQAPPKKILPKKPRVNRWVKALVIVACIIFLAGFLAMFVLQSASDLFGLNKPDQIVELTIPEGSSLNEITKLLEQNGIILKPLTFKLYAGLKDYASSFKPGDYTFNTNMSYDEIMGRLLRGNPKANTVSVTFPEGYTLRQIAAKLEENDVCSAEDFIAATQDGEFDYDFMEKLPDDELRFRRLEGYLFPDTYDFYIGENAKSVVNRFLSTFESKLTDEMYTQMKEMNMTLDETITLASIIQKETGGGTSDEAIENMRLVSSVFHNRMRLPQVYPKLQSDVTYQYYDNEIERYLDKHSEELYNAYSTYRREGLPVGPICNPSLEAIEAALSPADTGYYFFLSDSKGQLYYAETLEEHDRNVANVLLRGETAHGVDTKKD